MDLVIPLFPLNLVVFPESRYPLHIFEPRYKKMISVCVAEKKGFGIIAKVGNEISSIGSYVVVEAVLKKYESGEMDIIVRGINRFALEKIDIHENGYYVASVTHYNDKNSDYDSDLFHTAISIFKELLKKVNIELEEAFWNNLSRSENKSFKMAEKSGLSITERQELLIIQDENTRLRFLKEYFEKINEQVNSSFTDRSIITNDGFIN